MPAMANFNDFMAMAGAYLGDTTEVGDEPPCDNPGMPLGWTDKPVEIRIPEPAEHQQDMQARFSYVEIIKTIKFISRFQDYTF